MADSGGTLTVRELRRRWKPQKQRLSAAQQNHPTLVRFHRACSWLQSAEQMSEPGDDLGLITRWIAFNALYGQWNSQRREPENDRECWRRFLSRIHSLDADGQIAKMLVDHKKLVECLLEDDYLSNHFWQHPSDDRAGKSKSIKLKARGWYAEKSWLLVLDAVMDRVYLMRCQLVHGAATCGGKLNRSSLRHCSTMLSHVVTTILSVLVDHGADEDWGTMCYPPINKSRDSKNVAMAVPLAKRPR